MSGLVVGMIKRRAMAQPCKMILVCMADHGNDQGENIHRSMQKLAREACCHKRTVQKKVGHMVRIGLLVDVGKVTYGRGRLRGFRIDLDLLMRLFPDCHDVEDDLDPSDIAELIEAAEQEAGSGAKGTEQEAIGDRAEVAPAEVGEEEKGGPGPSFSDEQKGGPEEEKGGPESAKGWPQRPPEPLRTVQEPTRARDAGRPGGDPDGPPGSPAGQGDESGESERVNRHWKAGREYFVKRWGEALAVAWWDGLIPLRHDDDGTLVLDVPSRFWLDQVQARYSRSMEWALQQGGGSGLRFVVEGLAARVEGARKAKAEAEKQQSKTARARR